MTTGIKVITVLGAGQMGRGIAQVCAMSGYETYLYDINQGQVDAAREFIAAQLSKGVEKKKHTQEASDKTLMAMHFTTNLNDGKMSDIFIEAATENKVLKFQIFKNLDSIAKPGAILASNTSSISITEIASHTSRPTHVVGMHFMNPVPVMKLVEGIRGLETSDEIFEKTKVLAESLGKVFIKAQDYPGFAVNRILMPMINEAIYALYEGVASAQDIDQAMKLGTNQPMGPLELADFIGLDTCLAIMEVLFEGLGDSKYRPCPLLKNYVAAKK